jgi:hypothetical protein
MKKTFYASAFYSQRTTIGGDGVPPMYQSSSGLLITDLRMLRDNWGSSLWRISTPSTPAWTAQDIYDDAQGLPRMTELR